VNYDRITTTIEREWLAQIIADTRHAWQAGHKGLHRLGNAPAKPKPLWAAKSAQDRVPEGCPKSSYPVAELAVSL
jgi:hypothetical protein